MSQSALVSFWFVLEHHASPSVVQGVLPVPAGWHHPKPGSQVLFLPACVSPAFTQEIDQRHSDNGMILNVFLYLCVESYKRKEGNGNLLEANFFHARPV